MTCAGTPSARAIPPQCLHSSRAATRRPGASGVGDGSRPSTGTAHPKPLSAKARRTGEQPTMRSTSPWAARIHSLPYGARGTPIPSTSLFFQEVGRYPSCGSMRAGIAPFCVSLNGLVDEDAGQPQTATKPQPDAREPGVRPRSLWLMRAATGYGFPHCPQLPPNQRHNAQNPYQFRDAEQHRQGLLRTVDAGRPCRDLPRDRERYPENGPRSSAGRDGDVREPRHGTVGDRSCAHMVPSLSSRPCPPCSGHGHYTGATWLG